ARIHQNVSQCSGLRRRVPAFHIESAIRLRDAHPSRFSQPVLEAAASLHAFDDDLRSRVQYASKAEQLYPGHCLAPKIEYRGAVHYARFEPEAKARARSLAA